MQGNYTEWSAWSKCSKPCGEGERFRTRNCTNPPPAWGGLDCRFEGNDREQENCKIKDCPGKLFALVITISCFSVVRS